MRRPPRLRGLLALLAELCSRHRKRGRVASKQLTIKE
jgi:hypothetical protein